MIKKNLSIYVYLYYIVGKAKKLHSYVMDYGNNVLLFKFL